MFAFRARYEGWCAAECGEPIEVGNDVTYVETHLVHAWCSDTAADHLRSAASERPVTICPTCRLTKPCDCEDPS